MLFFNLIGNCIDVDTCECLVDFDGGECENDLRIQDDDDSDDDNDNDDDDDDKKWKLGLIIGGSAAGGLLTIFAVLCLLFCCLGRRRSPVPIMTGVSEKPVT